MKSTRKSRTTFDDRMYGTESEKLFLARLFAAVAKQHPELDVSTLGYTGSLNGEHYIKRWGNGEPIIVREADL
jgi:hypothetical protein